MFIFVPTDVWQLKEPLVCLLFALGYLFDGQVEHYLKSSYHSRSHSLT